MKASQMKTATKKMISAAIVCGGIIFVAVGVNRATDKKNATDYQKTETFTTEDSAYAMAQTELVFWYEDDSYKDFFEEAAQRYFEKTGKKVSVQCQDTIDYIGSIYDKTMQDDEFPDVYLIAGDNLEAAYLYGLVAVAEEENLKTGVMQKAVEAASYDGKQLGYPLSYNACLFVYQNGYFETVPESLQAIIDFSNDNEPAENVEYLLEWDVNDPFYDFPFVSNSVSFEKTEAESMKVVYDEVLYQKEMEFFDGILASFSVDASQVTEEGIIENFLAGRTLCAIIDTNSLYRLEGYDYSLMQLPRLNEELDATTCAITDMLLVNDFSKNPQTAADFAEFVTVDMADELWNLTGHYSVIPSETPDEMEQTAIDTYEQALLVPDSQDAKDFWIKLEETISKYF